MIFGLILKKNCNNMQVLWYKFISEYSIEYFPPQKIIPPHRQLFYFIFSTIILLILLNKIKWGGIKPKQTQANVYIEPQILIYITKTLIYRDYTTLFLFLNHN